MIIIEILNYTNLILMRVQFFLILGMIKELILILNLCFILDHSTFPGVKIQNRWFRFILWIVFFIDVFKAFFHWFKPHSVLYRFNLHFWLRLAIILNIIIDLIHRITSIFNVHSVVTYIRVNRIDLRKLPCILSILAISLWKLFVSSVF